MSNTVPLSALVSTTSQPDALSTILGIAGFLGLSTTAWQPIGMARTILATMAEVVARTSVLINLQAQGGYASYAAQMPGGGSQYTDAQGFLTTWMDLVSVQVFNTPRQPATFAQGQLPINNATGTLRSGGAGTLHAKNLATGATYTNTAAYAVPANAVGYLIPFVADVAGSNSTATTGTTLSLTTPIAGCSPQPLTADWTGAAAETNAALLVRCIAKLGSLSPNGAAGSYRFVATSIPQAPVRSITPPYAVTQPVTRVGEFTNKATGIVQAYLATASGPSLLGDVAVVNAAVQAFCVPNAQTVRSAPCTSFVQNIICYAYVPTAAGLTVAAIQNAAAQAQASYYGNMPVGGLSLAIPNQLPRDALIAVIATAIAALSPAYAQQMNVVLVAPASDGTMAASDVPVGSMQCAVVFT